MLMIAKAQRRQTRLGHNIGDCRRASMALVAVLICSGAGCTFMRKPFRTPPPKYTVFPDFAIAPRVQGNDVDWKDPAVRERMAEWKRAYSQAVDDYPVWGVDPSRLESELKDVFNENGEIQGLSQAWKDGAQRDILDKAKSLFGGGQDQLPVLAGDDRPRMWLENKIRGMFKHTDEEHPSILSHDPKSLKEVPALDAFQLREVLSYQDPINVSVTPVWSYSDQAEPQSAPPAKQTATLSDSGKGSVAISISGPEAQSQPAAATRAPSLPEFEPDQQITLNVSTVLNSPSVLDRIEYVSTYIYVYPWQSRPNRDLTLEGEFWRNVFQFTTGRDPSGLEPAMRSAALEMRVFIRDTGTTATLATIALGTQQENTTETATAGLGLAAPATAPTHLTPNLGYSQALGATSTVTQQQQLDYRATYLDPHGDFLRITQRGMQSANLAGRYKEQLTLHVPASATQYRVLVPKRDNDGKIVDYVLTTLSQPIYAEVDAFTFSVVEAREPTSLTYSANDHYGLDDNRDANFVVAVTPPQRVTLWRLERKLLFVDSSDVYGKSTGATKDVFVRTPPGGPSQLILAGFTPAEAGEFMSRLRTAGKLKPFWVDKPVQQFPSAGEFQIGYRLNEESPELTALGPSE